MKSVTDFLSAGRTAGRYLISVSSGVAGLGAISVVMFLEMGYIAGFSLAWWGLSQDYHSNANHVWVGNLPL